MRGKAGTLTEMALMYERAYRMREGGATFKRIGEELGVKINAAADMAEYGRLHTRQMWTAGLPSVLRNFLGRAFADRDDLVAALTAKDYGRLAGLGQSGAQILGQWLAVEIPFTQVELAAKAVYAASAEKSERELMAFQRTLDMFREEFHRGEMNGAQWKRASADAARHRIKRGADQNLIRQMRETELSKLTSDMAS